MMVTEVMSPEPAPDGWVTLTVMLPETVAGNPGALAVTAMPEQMTEPEVMRPVLSTVTQSDDELSQVTWPVMSRRVAGWPGCV